MPSTIPYDPSLTLTSVVNDAAIDNVIKVTQAQEPVEAAKETLNALTASKRSLNMTRTDLRSLGVPVDNLDQEIERMNSLIDNASAHYASTILRSQSIVMGLREQARRVHKPIESPVDYTRSKIKTMPMAADTMNMDIDYFSFDARSQSSGQYISQIAAYVSGSVSSVFEHSAAQELGAAASRQVSNQMNAQPIEGTLVLSVTCTHKNASIVTPLELHIDNAIKVWNTLFPGEKLDPTSGSSMERIARRDGQEDKKKFSIISGATFGSTFVGLVHVLGSGSGTASECMTAAAQSLRNTMDDGAWFTKAAGKIGVDPKFASDVQSLLNQQNVQFQVSVLTMGVVPSVTASDNSPQRNAQGQDMQPGSLHPEEQVEKLQQKVLDPALSRISVLDGNKDKAFDTSSMTSALDEYMKKTAEGGSGVPINFYLKDIDQKMLAQMWVAKYNPGQFMAIQSDDKEGDSFLESEKAKVAI